jgi:FkbH-like protein
MSGDAAGADRDRRELAAALEAADRFAAARAARRLLAPQHGGAHASFIRRRLDKTPAEALGLVPMRVALLSSFSIQFVHDHLIARGLSDGLGITVYQAGFGQYRQELLDPGSGLYRFAPHAVVLALEGRDVVPDLYLLDASEESRAPSAELVGEIGAWIEAFRSRSQAAVLVHDFAPPLWPRQGILEAQTDDGPQERLVRLNADLRRVCRSVPGVYVVDYAGLVARVGTAAFYDARMELYARAPIAPPALPVLAREHLKYLRSLSGKTRKCLVVDLDNTLWGGVLGEEGVGGIQLGPEYPGSAFLAFQHALRGLRRRGVLLAIASKNNPADVEEVFARHPHMLLRPEDFAAAEVGWGSKSESIARLASRLGIGLEHVVFADDNPVECDEVAHALPAVTVVELPARPEELTAALLLEGWFDGLNESAEDRRRTELYRQRDEAEALRGSSADLEDFYRRLDMDVVFAPVDPASLARTAQLTQKTNQFNATTRRHAEAEVSRRLELPDWIVRTVAVRDRFGDNGIVGVMMARQEGEEMEIDTFLLSCRVIGRTIESAMLALLCEEAAARGARVIRGVIVPTPKNEPVRDLYARHGFTEAGPAPGGGTSWRLDLSQRQVARPEWLRITSPGAVTPAGGRRTP